MQMSLPVEVPAGLVVFSVDGKAQFGWQNPETGAFYAEDDGHCIVDAVAGVPWLAGSMH
jgi:hypothetical protein